MSLYPRMPCGCVPGHRPRLLCRSPESHKQRVSDPSADLRAATDREIVRVVRETMLPIGRDFSMSAMTDQLEELLTKEGEGTR